MLQAQSPEHQLCKGQLACAEDLPVVLQARPSRPSPTICNILQIRQQFVSFQMRWPPMRPDGFN